MSSFIYKYLRRIANFNKNEKKKKMDILSKGVELIRRRSTLKRHKRTISTESNTSCASSTPSITNSITSDDGSSYSGGNLKTPSRRNSSFAMTPSITITPMISTPPQSPVNNNKKGKNKIDSYFLLYTY